MEKQSRVVISSGDSLDVLGLSVRARNALYRARIRTVGDLHLLLNAGEENLFHIRNLGEKGIAEVQSVLTRVQITQSPQQIVRKPKVISVYADRLGELSTASSLDALDLNIRVYNSLRRHKITTIAELLRLRDEGEDALYSIPQSG